MDTPFSGRCQSNNIILEDEGFKVIFDRKLKKWVLDWDWETCPPFPKNVQKSLGEYPKSLSSDERQICEQEVQKWIDNEIVVPYDPVTHGDIHNILTLMSVVQTHKETTPVGPVLDYRYLNSYVKGNPGNDVPVCDEFIRKWRAFGSDAHMLDIKKAYLQVFVSPSKLKYQAIKFR